MSALWFICALLIDILLQSHHAANASENKTKPLQIQPQIALQSTTKWKHGDIVNLNNLRPQRNQTLNTIVQSMNNSVAIVMMNPTRRRQNKTEVRLQWILNPETKVGIRVKYLQKQFPNIFIHNAINAETADALKLFYQLQLDPNKDVMSTNIGNAPFIVSRQILTENIDFIHPHSKILIYSQQVQSALYDERKLTESLAILFLKCSLSHIQGTVKVLQGSRHILPSLKTKLLPVIESMHSEIGEKCHDKLIEFAKNNFTQRSIEQDLLMLSKQIIRQNIGVFLNVKKTMYRIFWNFFTNTLMQICENLVNTLHRVVQIRTGSTISADIVNTYLLRSIRWNHDLHVIITSQTDLMDVEYDAIIHSIYANLQGNELYRHLVAKSIIKEVQYFNFSMDINSRA